MSDEQTPKEFGSFVGEIDSRRAQWVIDRLNDLSTSPVHVHILWACPGGETGAAITLHDYFAQYPHPLTLHATDARSAGAIAFLGAKLRSCSPYAVFMLHGVVCKMDGVQSIDQLSRSLSLARFDEKRVSALLKKDLPQLSSAQHSNRRRRELWFDATQAETIGLLSKPKPDFWPVTSDAALISFGEPYERTRLLR